MKTEDHLSPQFNSTHTNVPLMQSSGFTKKHPILQIVLFNFPVLQSLTLVKLALPPLNPHNPRKPRHSIHPHPSFGMQLVQPECNRGSDPDALDAASARGFLIHITSPSVSSLLIKRADSLSEREREKTMTSAKASGRVAEGKRRLDENRVTTK